MRSSGGGIMHTVWIGDYAPLGMTVWLCEGSLTNILALCDVEKKYRVTLDTATESAFIVHSEPTMKFKRQKNGLFVLTETNTTNDILSYSFLLTSDNRKEMFTPRQIKEAGEANRLYIKTTLSPSMFKEMIKRNKIRNANVTTEALQRHEYIYGQDILINIRHCGHRGLTMRSSGGGIMQI